jgi:hypothetical protein
MPHPRIEKLADFYRQQGQVCSFMNPDITTFVLVPDQCSDEYVGNPLIEWATAGRPLALSYVWENDPVTVEDEIRIATRHIIRAGCVLKSHVEKRHVSIAELVEALAALRNSTSLKSPAKFILSTENDKFYSIVMSPKHTSRYAPCFSVVLTRMSDIAKVAPDVRDRIRAESSKRFGREYNADGLFIT